MKILVYAFFGIFFSSSLLGVSVRLLKLYNKSSRVNTKLELYDNGDSVADFSDIYVERLSDSSVRSSVRYHKSLYRNSENYQEYRKRVSELQLP